MTQFRYRLATLLRLREAARDQRRTELAESRREDEKLVQQLEWNDKEQQRLGEACRKAAGPGTVDLAELIEADRYAVILQQQEERLRAARQSLAVEIDRRREALLAADRDVQVLEKLRDRRQQQHRQEEERQLAKQLDEAALRAHVAFRSAKVRPAFAERDDAAAFAERKATITCGSPLP
jgi:flagellar protein FliJ